MFVCFFYRDVMQELETIKLQINMLLANNDDEAEPSIIH